MVFFVKITGHELVTQKDDEGAEFDMLKVKLRGTGEDKKTRVELMVDADQRQHFPLGETGEVSFEIRQQRLELEAGS